MNNLEKYFDYETIESENEKNIKEWRKKWRKFFWSNPCYLLKVRIPYYYITMIRERQQELNMNSLGCQDYLLHLIEKDLKDKIKNYREN